MAGASSTVVIVQSNYLPWRGYFDLLRRADTFILYDEVQYTKNDWRNRNRLQTAQGLRWLTVPVRQTHLHQRIDETVVSDPAWARRHWRTLEQTYARAPYFELFRPALAAFYADPGSGYLSAINRRLLELVAGWLQITTPLRWSTAFPHQAAADRTARLVELVQAAGGTTYLSGPAAAAYLDVAQFAAAGLHVEWMDYGPYPAYAQLHAPPFEPAVSVLDLLFNTGPAAADYLQPVAPCRPDASFAGR